VIDFLTKPAYFRLILVAIDHLFELVGRLFFDALEKLEGALAVVGFIYTKLFTAS